MATNNRSTTSKPQNSDTEGKLAAYTVRKYDHRGETKSWWTRIGTARVNQDKSLNIYLDAAPFAGEDGVAVIVVRKETPKDGSNHG